MSRRVLLLAGLSVAAIFLASFVLLQGRSDVTRPLFPKPWGTSPTSNEKESDSSSSTTTTSTSGDEGYSESWLDRVGHNVGGLISSPHESAAPGEDAPKPDVTRKPDSPALSDPKEVEKPKGDGKSGTGEAPPSAGDMAQTDKDAADQGLKDKVTSSFGEDRPKQSGAGAELDNVNGDAVGVTITETGGFHDEVIKVDMVEVGGSHDEVIAALINSFGSQRNVKLELFQRLQRYGIKDIFDQFELSENNMPLPSYTHKTKFNATEHQPQILVSTTCELDSVEHRVEWEKLLKKEQTYLFCVVHHADRWGTDTKCHDVVRPWAAKGLVDFIGLSKHTQQSLHAELKKWDLGGVEPKSKYYIPVFPIELPEKYTTGKEDELGFALQGDFDPNRRDYKKIFNHLGGFINNTAEDGSDIDLETLELHLLGHGHEPEVPDFLKSHVKFDKSLDYLDFYGILSRTFALLPAFASEDYLTQKASSTVPASLIAGAPLVATQAILDSYTYLPLEAVWFQEDDEEDFDVVGRILAMTSEERKKKKDAVKKAYAARVELNKVLAAEWIREGLAVIRKLHPSSTSSGNTTKSPLSSENTSDRQEEIEEGGGAESTVDKRRWRLEAGANGDRPRR